MKKLQKQKNNGRKNLIQKSMKFVDRRVQNVHLRECIGTVKIKDCTSVEDAD